MVNSTGSARSSPRWLFSQGRFTATKFAAVPEFGLTLGWLACRNVWVTFGYSFIYWSDVVRPADAFDLSSDPARLAPSTFAVDTTNTVRPFGHTSMWIQGLDFGFEIRY